MLIGKILDYTSLKIVPQVARPWLVQEVFVKWLTWPDLRLPPINLWSLPNGYVPRYQITGDGVAHKRSSEYLKSKTVRDQLQFLEENWDRIRKDV